MSKVSIPSIPTEDRPKPSFPRACFDHWALFAQAIGVVQTRILMVLFYCAVALPTGILVRMTSDRLRLKHPKDGNWVPHQDQAQSLETARRQF